MDPSQYAELFLAESREHLSTVNQLLLEWERDPTAREPVEGVFRAVHTIKGMAATLGYGAVADLAHRAENLLDLVRRGTEPVTDPVVELLFAAADALEHGVEAAVAGREASLNLGALVRRLDEAAAGFERGVRRPSSARPSAPVMASPTGSGRTVRVTLRAEAALKAARAQIVLQRVAALGKLGGVEPPAAVLESDEFDGLLQFRLETTAPDEAIVEAARGAGEIESVGLDEPAAAAGAVEAAARLHHIRVDLRRLDNLMNLIGELVTLRGRLNNVAARTADPELEDVSLRVSRLSEELQSEIIQARMTPVWQVFDRFPRMVRDLARELGRQVAFRVEGKEIELDRAILDEIGDPLVHLIRNAVDHGIEPPEERTAAGKDPQGVVELSAARERATVAIRVWDDGRGLDRAKILAQAKQRGVLDADVEQLTDEMLVRVLARSGFSTASAVSAVSGRGVGIDVVAHRVRGLGGALEVQSTPGVGTQFTLRLPTTLAIVRALITRVGDERYALPVTHVAETLDLDSAPVAHVDERDALSLRDELIPLVHLRRMVGVEGERPRRSPVVVLQIGARRSGLVVDQLLGQREIVVKPFAPVRGMLPIFAGATVLGEGEPTLILDAGGLV
ncbi:MAG: chemotaxis protein CheA [Gemmatimonadales bacterium]|jgi:two-component system chemotaxis sensor kinase CheA